MSSTRSVVVAFDLPFAVYIRSKLAFDVPFRGAKYRVYFEDRRFLGETRFGKAQNCELREDKRGTFRFSRVFLRFETPLSAKDVDKLIEEARLVTNRLIGWYRFITDRAYIETVRKVDIHEAMVQVQLDDGNWQGAAVCTPPGGLGSLIPEDPLDKLQALDKLLQRDIDVPAHVDLFIGAKDALRQENHRAAIIDAQSALEIYIESVLIDAYCRLGMSRLAAQKHLRTGNNWKISVRVKDLLKSTVGLDLTKDAALWNRWIKAKRLRDSVAHQGYPPKEHGPEPTREALDTYDALIRRVEAHLES